MQDKTSPMREPPKQDSITRATPSFASPPISRHETEDSTTSTSSLKSSTSTTNPDPITPPPPPQEALPNINDDDPVPSKPSSITRTRALLSTLSLALLIFTQSSNMSMLTTIQSDVAASLDAYDNTSWFTSAYLIAMSSLGPFNGKLATIFAPRTCILVSSLIFGAGSFVTSRAETFGSFVFGRAFAGTGASGIFTVSIVVVLELSGAKGRGLGIGLLNSGYTFGVAIGAVAAGELLPKVGWRALFWMQTPVCVVAGVLLFLALPAEFGGETGQTSSGKAPSTSSDTIARLRKVDYLGALTLTASIAIFLYALSSPTHIPLPPIFISLAILALFIFDELYLTSDPIIPLALLRSRGLLLTCASTVGYMMSRWTVLFYAPTYALALQDWSPTRAGAILVPTNIAFAVGGLLVGWLHIRREGSFYIPTILTYALFPLTLLGLAMLSRADSSPWGFVVAVAACGGVTGAALNYTLAHLLHLTPKDTHYVASALLATFRGFAGSFGAAIGGGLFTRTLGQSLRQGFDERGLKNDELVRKLLGSPALVGHLNGAEREVAMIGYEKALKVLFLAAAALALTMVFVQASAGWKGLREESSDGERRPLLGNLEEQTRIENDDRHRA